MVWNIQRFGINKFTEPEDFGQFRLWHILNTVDAVDPDIFVVLELGSAKGVTGSLICTGKVSGSSGLEGCEMLFRALNEPRDGIRKLWYLVPPLKLTDKLVVTEHGVDKEANYVEGIAFFYRGDRLRFTGPYVWPRDRENSDSRKVAVPAGTAIAGRYPERFAAMMPPDNFFAGRYKFCADKSASDCPDKEERLFPFKDCRRPFLCDFEELERGQRKITVAALHTSPNRNPYDATLQLLEWMPDPAPNQVLVVCGDFNIQENELFGLRDRVNHDYGFETHFSRQQATMLRSGATATFQPERYLSENDAKAADNIFTRYGANAGRPANFLNFVVNRVVGTMDGAREVYPTDMYTPIRQLRQAAPDEANEAFREMWNYGKIAHHSGVSDHMALKIDL